MIKIFAKTGQPKVAELLIYDFIGEDWYGDGVSANSVNDKLKAMGSIDQINVRINSPGGSVFDGIAIYNMLKSHDAKVRVIIEGLAASAASIIAMAGDEVEMGVATQIMIHNPWTLAYGEAKDFRKVAETLDIIRDGMIEAYSARTGIDAKELIKMCDAETWMGPDAAIEKGFADRKANIEEDDEEKEEEFSEKAQALLARFKHQNRYQPAVAAAIRHQQRQKPVTPAASQPSAAAEPNEVIEMTPEEIEAARKAAEQKAAKEARTAALAAEKERQDAIRAHFEPFASDHRALMDACLADQNCTESAAATKLLAALGAQSEPISGGTAPVRQTGTAGQTAAQKFLIGAESALLARAGRGKREQGNEFNGMSLCEVAAHALGLAGVSTKGMSKDQIARKVMNSHTTSDFPLLLGNLARKRLRDAYATVPRTWDKLVRIGSVPDFKQNDRLTLGSFSSLVLKPERGEYKQGTLGEESIGLKAQTKGRYISFSREMLVNDDLGAFDNMSTKMGQAAGRTVEIDFYSLLLSNSGVGPTMPDTGAFFNATAVTTAGGHANYTSSGTILSVTSLGLANAMMKRQQDLARQEYVGITPKILLVAPEYEALAWTIINSTADPGQANPARGNYARTLNLTVISSPYITGTSWYLFADPSLVEAFEVAFLDGNQEPYIDDEIEFMSDNYNMKVRLDYGMAAIDWRAAYKNNGAAS